MNTTWKFTDLNSIADYYENKGRDMRARAADFSEKSPYRKMWREVAAELESVAYVLRHTELTGGPK